MLGITEQKAAKKEKKAKKAEKAKANTKKKGDDHHQGHLHHFERQYSTMRDMPTDVEEVGFKYFVLGCVQV